MKTFSQLIRVKVFTHVVSAILKNLLHLKQENFKIKSLEIFIFVTEILKELRKRLISLREVAR